MTTRTMEILDQYEAPDELCHDRLPGMPLVGFLAGTVFSLLLWGAAAVIAWPFLP